MTRWHKHFYLQANKFLYFVLFVCLLFFVSATSSQSKYSQHLRHAHLHRSFPWCTGKCKTLDWHGSKSCQYYFRRNKGKLLSDVQPDLEKLKKQLCPWISATFKEPYLRRRFIYIDGLISSFKRRLSNLLLRLLYFWFSSGFKKLRPRCKFKMLFPS